MVFCTYLVMFLRYSSIELLQFYNYARGHANYVWLRQTSFWLRTDIVWLTSSWLQRLQRYKFMLFITLRDFVKTTKKACYFLCRCLWVIKTKQGERKKKEGIFFVFGGFKRFRVFKILNCTFIWTLSRIWVCRYTGSSFNFVLSLGITRVLEGYRISINV